MAKRIVSTRSGLTLLCCALLASWAGCQWWAGQVGPSSEGWRGTLKRLSDGADLVSFPAGPIEIPRGRLLVVTGLEVPSAEVRAQLWVDGKMLVGYTCTEGGIGKDMRRSLHDEFELRPSQEVVVKSIVVGGVEGVTGAEGRVLAWGYWKEGR